MNTVGPEPRRECATCGAVRPVHELACIADLDSERDAWHCRDCLRAGRAGTGVDPLDEWLVGVLDANVAAEQKRQANPEPHVGARVRVLGCGEGRIVDRTEGAGKWVIHLDAPSTYPGDAGVRLISRFAGEFHVIPADQKGAPA